MSAELEDVPDDSFEVLVENVEEVALLGHIDEQLVVLNVVTLQGELRVKVSLDFINSLLQSLECLETDFPQVQRVKVSLLVLEANQSLRERELSG